MHGSQENSKQISRKVCHSTNIHRPHCNAELFPTLALFSADSLVCVANSLALVRLRRSPCPNSCCKVTQGLLVVAGDIQKSISSHLHPQQSLSYGPDQTSGISETNTSFNRVYSGLHTGQVKLRRISSYTKADHATSDQPKVIAGNPWTCYNIHNN